nr:NADH dehydrogenase subunit 4L [Lepidostoma basale]
MKTLKFVYLIVLNFFLGNLMFSLNRKHLLIILISLEMIMLNMFILVLNFISATNSIYFFLMFMVLSVCEGVLGISVLVYLIRVYGNDLVKIHSFL